MKKKIQIRKQDDDFLFRDTDVVGGVGGGKAQCITTRSNTAGIGKFFVDMIFEYEEDLDKAVPARI